MYYKTIILQLLQERPQLHDRLRADRSLLSTVEHYARELKTRHEALKEVVCRAKPDSDPSQTAGEALELALKETEAGLSSASPPDGPEAPSLDGAMAFTRLHAPHD